MGEEERLPGLSCTPKQLFWIPAAGNWCSKQRPQSLRLRMLTGSHSPGKVRVMTTLSNMEEFARDFQCPVGSKMNPKEQEVPSLVMDIHQDTDTLHLLPRLRLTLYPCYSLSFIDL